MDTVTVSPSQEEASSESRQLTVREYAFEAIQKNFHKSIKHKKDVLADRETEAIHQMRVGMRRLRTALAVFDAFVSLPPNLERDITKLSKGLGNVRDLDVLGIWFSDYKKAINLNEEEEEQLTVLLRQLDRRRKKQFEQMGRTLKGKRYRQFEAGLQQWLNHPAFLPGAEWPIQLVLPDLLLPLINRLLSHPSWLVTTSGSLEIWKPTAEIDATVVNTYLAEYGPLLHDLRKQTKRARYQTEFFMDFYGKDYSEQTLEFRAIQDLLGQLQDSQVLSDFLTQEIGTEWNVRIPSLNLYFHQQRLELWLQWQTIQQKYLKTDFRKHLRALLEKPHYSHGETS
jgi:CHAD domain-containing protein